MEAEADWGYSDYHGWVYGYSFETVVSAAKGSLVLPLLGSVGPAGTGDAHAARPPVGARRRLA